MERDFADLGTEEFALVFRSRREYPPLVSSGILASGTQLWVGGTHVVNVTVAFTSEAMMSRRLRSLVNLPLISAKSLPIINHVCAAPNQEFRRTTTSAPLAGPAPELQLSACAPAQYLN